MARPRKDDSEKRIVQVNIRLTVDEARIAKKYADLCTMTPANWIRHKVFKGKFPVIRMSPLDHKIYIELRRIGVNLNQGTYRLNRGDVPTGYMSLQIKLLAMLDKIHDLLSDDGQPD